jgi:DNA invertase Pin-like site-specific DNA recombinase
MENQEETTGSSSSRRALIYLRSAEVGVVVCTALDRLSRDPGELLDLIARLEAAGIRLETIEEGDVFARPEIVHCLERLALDSQGTHAHSRISGKRKRSKKQQGRAHPAPHENLPLFEE